MNRLVRSLTLTCKYLKKKNKICPSKKQSELQEMAPYFHVNAKDETDGITSASITHTQNVSVSCGMAIVTSLYCGTYKQFFNVMY